MDGIELARQIATDLHIQAVGRGENPFIPYQFVIAEAKRQEIDVEPASADAAVLNGSRATFIPEEALIIHEKVGTLFEQAFLVAHEIGHIVLGDNPETTTVSKIDLTRSAEPSPVGIDRVVDYSPQQRREIQMDLFAREFLLPRPVLRALHIKEKLTVSQISEKFGAPFEVVAQQLLDALLLPPVTITSTAIPPSLSLNQLQIDAATHYGKAYLLEAGPGTGKTHTLIARVEKLLADGIDPRKILLLTFSNKAAEEMANRIALKDSDAACAMWVGTFHAFGLDVIRRFHIELGLPQTPRLLDRTDAMELLEQELPRLDLTHYRNLYDPTQNISNILQAISRAKDEVINSERYRKLAEAMRLHAVTSEEQEAAEKTIEVARVYTAYETLKQQAGCIDFGDLVLLPVLLLEKHANIRIHLSENYDHILVDEYQDVNRSSVRLLKALCNDGENLWVVGDAKQSIYRFRGASSYNMTRFGKEDFPNGQRGRLKQNYRSVEEIVSSFSTFAVGMETGDPNSGLEAHRPACGHHPEFYTVNQTEEQTVALADSIEAQLAHGYCYRKQAVLCTGNAKLSSLAQDLENLGIPVLFLGSLFERAEVKDAFSLLSLLIDQRAMGLVRIACWPEFNMSMADVDTVTDYLRQQEESTKGWLDRITAIPNVSTSGQTALTKIAKVLEGFDQTSSPWIVLATVLLERTQLGAKIATSNDIRERSKGIALWQVMNFIRTQPSGQGLPIKRLLERVRRLIRLGDDRGLYQLPTAAQGLNAVRLMTIHGAKGLEFPIVHVPHMNAGTIPRIPPTPPCPPPDGMVEGSQGTAQEIFRAEQAQEQECLFYVALSRARDRLLFYAPTQQSNGRRWKESPFLSRIGPELNKQHIIPSRRLPEVPEDRNIELVINGVLRFSASQINLYESCPRRFFYTHILRLGGRRKENAFMQMHEAVRSATQELMNQDITTDQSIDIDKQINEAMPTDGLENRSYSKELRNFAIELIHYFIASRAGYTPESPTTLTLLLNSEKITVRPDDVLVGADGKHKLRRIQTGHVRKGELDSVGTAAFLLAVQQTFPDATVEFLYLSDKTLQVASLSKTQLKNRQNKLVNFFSDIRQGIFPAKPSERKCPGCPAFFVCGPAPVGPLAKKFEDDLPV